MGRPGMMVPGGRGELGSEVAYVLMTDLGAGYDVYISEREGGDEEEETGGGATAEEEEEEEEEGAEDGDDEEGEEGGVA